MHPCVVFTSVGFGRVWCVTITVKGEGKERQIEGEGNNEIEN